MTLFEERVHAPSLRKSAPLLIAAIALHNLEEGLTFPSYSAAISQTLEWVGMTAQVPDWSAFRVGLALATIGPALILSWAASGAVTRLKAVAVIALATFMLVNALVPHIPVSLAMAGYSPGIASAVLVNLPLCGWVLAQSRRERWLPAGLWSAIMLAATVALPFVMAAILWIAGGMAT